MQTVQAVSRGLLGGLYRDTARCRALRVFPPGPSIRRPYSTPSKENAEDVGFLDSADIADDLQPVAPVNGNGRGKGVPQVPESSTAQRPKLPTSIKKINRLLSHQREMHIPESDLEERFDRGRGPGGQAINKTNSAVSLIHIPTGIRVQAQPTRSREENRKAARRILAEKLDLLKAQTALTLPQPDNLGERVKTRKEREKELAGVWSREEMRWEKERRRKTNRAKKSKRKKKDAADPDDVQADDLD